MDNNDEKKPAALSSEQYCAQKGLNYILLEEVLLKDECAAVAAKLLYKIIIANRTIERWGIIYYGCLKSRLFTEMSRTLYFETFSMVFPGFPKKATIHKSIVESDVALSYENKPSLDDANCQEIRRQIYQLQDLMDELFLKAGNAK